MPDETDLLRRLRLGDADAYDHLASRHARRLYRLAYALLGNEADAEDAVQQTYVGALHGIRSFEARSSLGTWLQRILIHQVSKLRRSRRVRLAIPLDESEAHAGNGNGRLKTTSPATSVEQRVDIMSMIDSLSAEHRQVIVLREIEGLSYQEIADQLGVPRGTVESRLFRAREVLKQRFGTYLQ